MGKFQKYIVTMIVLLLTCTVCVKAQSLNIKNDIFWNTKDGQPIRSQGGGIFKFIDSATGQEKYYWYGVYYDEADAYRNNPTAPFPNCTFKSVTCYSSTDLVNWTFENDVFTKDEAFKTEKKTWVGRLGVLRLGPGPIECGVDVLARARIEHPVHGGILRARRCRGKP